MTGTFALFDIQNFLTPLKRVLPPMLVVVVAAIATPWPAFAIGAAAIAMSLLAANPFAADERGRLDTLYSTLPVSRRSVVVGRYLALLAVYAVVAVLATVVAIVVPLVRGEEVDYSVLLPVNLVSLVIFSVALAVQLPFFFSLGFTRARPMMYLPVAVLIGAFYLASQTGLLDRVDPAAVASGNPAVLALVGVGGSLVALVVSAVVSIARYGRRPL